MTESSPQRPTALDRPALGLVMQLAALVVLPGQLSMAATVAIDLGGDLRLLGLTILQVVATGLQLAAGIAIARRSFARLLFVAYCASALVLAVAVAIWFQGDDEGAAHITAVTIETLSGPLVIVIAPLALDLDRLPDRRSPADVAAVLVVLAASSLIALPVNVVDQIHMLMSTQTSLGPWFWSIVMWVVPIVNAMVALRAGRVLLRSGPPHAARRAVAAYMLVNVGTYVALDGVTIIAMLVNDVGYGRTSLIVHMVISLAISLARPLAIWAYARNTLRDPIAVVRQELSAPLVWIALWIVPLLLSRVPALDNIGRMSGVTLAVALGALLVLQAAVNITTVRTALRNDGRAFLHAVTATFVAAGLLGTLLVWLYVLVDRDTPGVFRIPIDKPVWPLALLIATLGTLAWSQRRQGEALPGSISTSPTTSARSMR